MAWDRDAHKRMEENLEKARKQYAEERQRLEDNAPSQASRDAWALATILGAGYQMRGSAAITQAEQDKQTLTNFTDTYKEKWGNTFQAAFAGAIVINSKKWVAKDGYSIDEAQRDEFLMPLTKASRAIQEVVDHLNGKKPPIIPDPRNNPIQTEEIEGMRDKLIASADFLEKLYVPHSAAIKQISQSNVPDFMELLEKGRLKEAANAFPEEALMRLHENMRSKGEGASP